MNFITLKSKAVTGSCRACVRDSQSSNSEVDQVVKHDETIPIMIRTAMLLVLPLRPALTHKILARADDDVDETLCAVRGDGPGVRSGGDKCFYPAPNSQQPTPDTDPTICRREKYAGIPAGGAYMGKTGSFHYGNGFMDESFLTECWGNQHWGTKFLADNNLGSCHGKKCTVKPLTVDPVWLEFNSFPYDINGDHDPQCELGEFEIPFGPHVKFSFPFQRYFYAKLFGMPNNFPDWFDVGSEIKVGRDFKQGRESGSCTEKSGVEEILCDGGVWRVLFVVRHEWIDHGMDRQDWQVRYECVPDRQVRSGGVPLLSARSRSSSSEFLE